MRALLLTLLLPAAAFAQATAVKDKEEIKFNEIERGFTVGAAGGFWMFVNSPGPAPTSSYPNPRPLTMGQTARIDLGFDIGERVVAGIMLQAANNRAGSDYLGTTLLSASGDFSELMPGAAVKVNIIGFEDNQNVKRTHWVTTRASPGLRASISPARSSTNSTSICRAAWGSSTSRSSATSPSGSKFRPCSMC